MSYLRLLFLLPCHGRNRVFHTHSSAALGSSCTLSHCLRHGGRFHLSQSILLTREFTLLENHMIYHQAEQVSQCDRAAVVKGARHPFIGRLITLISLPAAWRQVSSISIWLNPARVRNESSARYVCSARVSLSCWQARKIMSESTGCQVKMICSEMFVFCSGLLVSLTFGVSCQRSRLSEIRWLNVKQPASTRLWLAGETHHERVICVLLEPLGLARK